VKNNQVSHPELSALFPGKKKAHPLGFFEKQIKISVFIVSAALTNRRRLFPHNQFY